MAAASAVPEPGSREAAQACALDRDFLVSERNTWEEKGEDEAKLKRYGLMLTPEGALVCKKCHGEIGDHQTEKQKEKAAQQEPAAAAAGLFEEIKDLVSRLEHRIEDLTVQVENKNNTGFSQHSRDDAERARAKQKACELQKACEQDDVGAAQCVACEPDAQCSHVEFAHMLARGASAFLVHRFGQQFQPMLAWVCMDSARMHFYATFNPKLGMSTKRHRYVLVHCVRLPSGRIVSLGPVDSYMKMLPLCKSLHKVFDECGGLFLSTQPHKLPGVMKREGVSKMSAKRFKKVARRVGGDPVSPVPDPFGSNSKGENSEDDSSGSSSNDNDGGSGGGTASDDEPVFQSDEEPQSVLCNGCNRYHSFSSFGNTDLTIQKMPETWCSLCQSYREAPHDPRTMYLCCNLREQSQSARDLLLSETQKLGELSRARKLVEVAHTVASGSPVQARACDEETDDHIEAKVNVNHDSGFCSIELRCGAGYLGEYFNTYGMAAFLHCCAEVQQTILHHAGEKSNSAAAAAAAALEEEAAEDPGDDE